MYSILLLQSSVTSMSSFVTWFSTGMTPVVENVALFLSEDLIESFVSIMSLYGVLSC